VTLTSRVVAAALIYSVSISAQTALVDRGGGMVYDTTRNITWMADWNYAKTSGYDADGLMTSTEAWTWADQLVYGGYDDWRLPSALNVDGSGPCLGLNCTSSELGHMFHSNWGAAAGANFSSGTNSTNLALFINVQSHGYFTGTSFAPVPSHAWYFQTSGGRQDYILPSPSYAVAVRDGDVIAVPEPQAYALALIGFGAVLLAARRRQRLGTVYCGYP
jgi:hypothetical protein